MPQVAHLGKSRPSGQCRVLNHVVLRIKLLCWVLTSPATMSDQTTFRSRIRELLNERYNEGELRSLVFDLGVDYENLPGNTKDDKARELIRYCEARNMISELINGIKRERPEVNIEPPLAPNQVRQPFITRDARRNGVTIASIIVVIVSLLAVFFSRNYRTTSSNDMVLVRAGDFIMGDDQGAPDQRPARKVYLDSYWIDLLEVTNVQYQKFTAQENRGIPDHWENGRYPSGYENHPVVGISWYDADAYCRFVGKRLPTEAEWEKAARGTDGLIWPWGNFWDRSKANTLEADVGNTMPVGSYKTGVSPFGAYDMAGNVWEWVDDWFLETYYASSPDRNPHNSMSRTGNATKVVRGGSWVEDRDMSRTYFRLGIYPPEYPPEVPERLLNPVAYIGFRCACDNCR